MLAVFEEGRGDLDKELDIPVELFDLGFVQRSEGWAAILTVGNASVGRPARSTSARQEWSPVVPPAE